MRMPVVFRQSRENVKRMIHSIAHLTIETDRRGTTIKVIPLYTDAGKRGGPFTFMEIPNTFTKELINASIANECNLTYITVVIDDICEIELMYNTDGNEVEVTFHNLMKPEYKLLTMTTEGDECIITVDDCKYIYNAEQKAWIEYKK